MSSFQFTAPVFQLLNANSIVYANAKIEFFLTGTDTNSPVYQDSDLTTPHTNPVIASAGGLFPPIYLDQTILYKAVISDENNNVIQTIDPVKVGYGAGLVAIDGLSPTANKLPYYTGATAAALTDFTAYGRSLVAAASEAAFKELTNLEADTDFPSKSTYDAHVAQALVDSDVGTTANKLVQLDGSARLPAVDGSQLTNIGYVVWESTSSRLASEVSATSGTWIDVGSAISRACQGTGHRIVVKGAVHGTGSSGSANDRDGLEIRLLAGATVVGTVTGWAAPSESWSGDFAFDYYPGSTASIAYKIQTRTVNGGSSIFTQDVSYFRVTELRG